MDIPAEDRQESHVESPRSGVSGLSGLSARYRSFSPGGVVQSQHNQTMMLRSAAMQLAGASGKEEGGVVTRPILRKTTEALEEKIARQLRKVNQEMSNTVDATLAGVEKRLSGTETVQKKLERKFAEVAGNWKGLSEEMQAQIRRSEDRFKEVESRLGEIRRQATEEQQRRNMDFEQKLQKATSASRVANSTMEEQLKRQNQRLQVVESFLEERMKHEMEATEALHHLSSRIAALEDSHESSQEAPVTPRKAQEREALDLDEHPLMLSLQRQVKDATHTLERLEQETHELHAQLDAQLGAQEERMNTVRTLLESKDRELRAQSQNSELEEKLEKLRQQFHEKSLEKAEHHDSLDLLHRRLVSQEQAHDELRGHLLRSTRATPVPGCASVGGGSTPRGGTPGANATSIGNVSGFATPPGNAPALPGSSLAAANDSQEGTRLLPIDSKALAGLEARVEDSEGRIGETVERIVSRMEGMQSAIREMQKGQHDVDEINHLVEQLKGVAPRIVEHDLQLKEHKQSHAAHQEALQEHTDSLSRIQQAVDALGDTHQSVHRENKEEFTALWKECSSSTSSPPEEKLSMLVREASSAIACCSSLQADVKALREELTQGSHDGKDDCGGDISEVSSAMQCCSSLQANFKALREELLLASPVSQESFDNMASEVRSAMKCCSDITSEFQSLRTELRDIAAVSDQAARSAPSEPSASDLEGRHSELHARLLDLETKSTRQVGAPTSGDVEALASRMAHVETTMGNIGNQARDQDHQMLNLQQRVSSCERTSDDLTHAAGRIAEMGRAIAHLGNEDVCGRLKTVEHGLQEHRITTAEMERGLAEHRASVAEAERALAEHKVETREALATSLGATAQHSSHGDLSGRVDQVERDLAEHRSTVTRQLEQGASEQKLAAEKALAEDRQMKLAAVEQMLERRQPGDLAGRLDELEKQLADHRSALPQMDQSGNLAGRLDEFERQLAEHRSAQPQMDKAGDLAGRLENVEQQFAEHRAASLQIGQGLSEQRAAAEKVIADHKLEVERMLAEQRAATPDHGDLAGRLESIVKEVAEHRASASEGLSGQRAAAEKALAEHKAEMERALADHRTATADDGGRIKELQGQLEALTGRISALSAPAPSQDEEIAERISAAHKALEDQRASTEKALGEHKADIERVLAEHRGELAVAAPQQSHLHDRISEAERALAEHKAGALTEGDLKDLRRSHVALSDKITKMGTSSEKVAELAERLVQCESRFAKLETSPALPVPAESNVQALGDVAEGDGEKLLELLNTVSQDDEAEQRAHRNLVSRIDELCEHIISVKSAADSSQSGTNGVSPEVSKRLEDAIARVQQSEEWQKRMEEQMTAIKATCEELRSKPQDEEV